jgi:hypothetical protein
MIDTLSTLTTRHDTKPATNHSKPDISPRILQQAFAWLR